MHALETYALVSGAKIGDCWIQEEEIQIPEGRYITFHPHHDKGTARKYLYWHEWQIHGMVVTQEKLRSMTTSTALPSFVISESERKKQIIKTTDRKVRANYLKGKHSKTITQLKEKLGFKEEITVIAWLLEQVEQKSDLNQTIYQLLED